jgi:hypothetical protein
VGKKALDALANLNLAFNIDIAPDNSIKIIPENISVPEGDFSLLRIFTFKDTNTLHTFIAYWIGRPSNDNYPIWAFNLRIIGVPPGEARIVNLLTGEVYQAVYNQDGDTLTFENLPIYDSPFLLILTQPLPVVNINSKLNFFLSQNYPNPFNSGTNITYSIDRGGHVILEIYNILGQLVRTLVNEVQQPGVYTIYWDGRDENGRSLPSGVYFYRIEVNRFIKTRKMLMIR